MGTLSKNHSIEKLEVNKSSKRIQTEMYSTIDERSPSFKLDLKQAESLPIVDEPKVLAEELPILVQSKHVKKAYPTPIRPGVRNRAIVN